MQLLKKLSTGAVSFAALAQNIQLPPPIPWSRGLTLDSLFRTVVGWLLIIAGVVAVLYLVFGGFQYLTAGGDADKVTKAKTTIINAIVGIVVIALAFGIYTAVIQFVSAA